MIYDLDLSFIEGLQATVTATLKRWTEVYKTSFVSLIYRPREKFGVGITSLSESYKKAQVNKALILEGSSDPTTVSFCEHQGKKEEAFTRQWKPIPELRNLQEQLEQGTYTKLEDTHPFDLSWSHLIGSRNIKLIKWILNASTNSLVTPQMRKIWSSDKCFLCDKQCSLHHILSHCDTALRQKRYTWRHDSVLKTLECQLVPFLEEVNKAPVKKISKQTIKFVKQDARMEKSKARARRPTLLDGANDWKWIFDYDEDQFVFPAHTVITDERPDILIHSDSERKTMKYHETLIPLIKDQNKGWSVTLRTIEVGVRGLVSHSVTRCLKQLGMSQTQKLVKKVSPAAAACSCYIKKAARSKR